MAEPLLTTHSLRLVIDGRTLLDDINLQIHAGRTLAILGANGAGKSLLLRVLHGLIPPTNGDVLMHGKAPTRATRDRQAMIFQRPVMLRRTVAQNLDFAIRARGIDKAERKQCIAQSLSLARLQHKSRQAARSLSGGEQQRLALARAMVAKPALLFLDEATASLDPASTAVFESTLADATSKGTTAVLVTHDIHQAHRLADDIIFLHEGRIAETGPLASVLQSPSSMALQDWLAGRLPATDDRSNIQGNLE